MAVGILKLHMKIENMNEAKTNVLSGLTVALALVPEAITFAFVAQVHPLVGLYAAFMVGLITSLIGGRPGMISGAAGSLAVVMVAVPVVQVWRPRPRFRCRLMSRPS